MVAPWWELGSICWELGPTVMAIASPFAIRRVVERIGAGVLTFTDDYLVGHLCSLWLAIIVLLGFRAYTQKSVGEAKHYPKRKQAEQKVMPHV
jgi:hypothetical protein